MKYASQYFQSAIAIIRLYEGDIPLAAFLKHFFSQHKKYGSKDRKWIAHLCYNFYRLGKAVKDVQEEERLRVAIFLCNAVPDDWEVLFDKTWIANWHNEIAQRVEFVQTQYPGFSVAEIFPGSNALSNGINHEKFSVSHLEQPDLFLRIRPGNENPVLRKLAEAGLAYTQISSSCIAMPNASKVDGILAIDEEVVIQDMSSQRVGEFLQIVKDQHPSRMSVWDCCAASGGKSILAKDILEDIDLTVSDLRLSILHNLRQRFERAHINDYQAFVANLSEGQPQMASAQLLIVDAPCTGSGTWGRTPEQLYFFTEEKLNAYTALQRNIVRNVAGLVESGGYLLYITCSVFREENEAAVEMIRAEFPLELVYAAVLEGFTMKADTMFAALLKKA